MLHLNNRHDAFQFLGVGISALFPLLAVGFRHTAGVMLVLTMLLSLAVLRHLPWRPLDKNERLVILVVVVFFISAVASSISIGWDENAWRGLGVQLRYLCFIPIYLMFRAMKDPLSPFLFGLSVGGCILGVQSIAEVWLEGLPRAEGAYNSPGFLGIHALLTLVFCQYAYLERDLVITPRPLLGTGAVAAAVAFVLCGSRSTYITSLLLVLTLLFLGREKSFRMLSVSLSLLLIFAAILSDLFTSQVRDGLSEIHSVLTTPHGELEDLGTVAHRLHMWIASIFIFQEYPLLGIGWRNFSTYAEPLIASKNLSPIIAVTPHPHSTYFNALASHGLLGLVSMLLVWLVPLYIARKNKITSPAQANLLQIFVVCFALNSLSEGGTFIYNNTTSIYFFTFSVLFSTLTVSMFRQARSTSPKF